MASGCDALPPLRRTGRSEVAGADACGNSLASVPCESAGPPLGSEAGGAALGELAAPAGSGLSARPASADTTAALPGASPRPAAMILPKRPLPAMLTPLGPALK